MITKFKIYESHVLYAPFDGIVLKNNFNHPDVLDELPEVIYFLKNNNIEYKIYVEIKTGVIYIEIKNFEKEWEKFSEITWANVKDRFYLPTIGRVSTGFVIRRYCINDLEFIELNSKEYSDIIKEIKKTLDDIEFNKDVKNFNL